MNAKKPRIIFMGTPQFAVASLEACLEVGEVVLVITQPDKPKGRGQDMSESKVKERAKALGIPVEQPRRLRNEPAFEALLSGYRADIAVVTAYGKILPPDILRIPRFGCVNVHASLLPRFRGAAPIQWAIAHGDETSGVCLMQMDEGMDTGAVIDRAEVKLKPDETSSSLSETLSALGGQLIRKSLPRYLSGELKAVPQPSVGVLMAPMIQKEDGRLDFSKSAVELERRIRAFTPWPGTFFESPLGPIKVHGARVSDASAEPGTVTALLEDGIEIACGSGALVLTRLQAPSKRVMSAKEFLNGHRLAVGTKLLGEI
jgi:methionyl-tRNA formyltransferase